MTLTDTYFPDAEPETGDDVVAVPHIETPTHVYMVLPVSAWPDAAAFICGAVGPEAPFPDPDNPDNASVLVAVNRQSLQIEGYMAVKRELLVDNFAAVSGAKVSYSAFHALLQSTLPQGAVYYTAVGVSEAASAAADRAGLSRYAELRTATVGEVGVEGQDAVGSDHPGGHRSSR